MQKLYFVLSCSIAISACSTLAGRVELLTKRASFDLQCPEETLETVDLGAGRTYGVRGCSKQATYVAGPGCRFGNPASACQWIMNTDERTMGGEIPRGAGTGPAPHSDVAGPGT